jgi:replicative DNA helicase
MPINLPLHKLPPQSIEAEQSILGAILLENHAIDRAIRNIQPDDFYKESHRRIYSAMLDLNEVNEPIDIITLPAKLKSRDEFDKTGGISYLAMLVNAVPNAANIRYHCKIVQEKATLRNLIYQASNLITKAYDEPEDLTEFMDEVGGVFMSLTENKKKRGLTPSAKYIPSALQVMEERTERKEGLTGVSTGLSSLDEKTGGLQPSDLIIVAGRPSMGKSAIAVNNFGMAAAMNGKKAALFSLEMSTEQLVIRMLAANGQIDGMRAKNGTLNAHEWGLVIKAAGRLQHTGLFINDTPALTTFDIMAQCRTMKREHGLDLVIIDYLQLIHGHKKTQSREQEISSISRSLKEMAKYLNVPVIALSQLSRKVEERQDKRPMLSDLRESGAIEQDADVIMFLYREEFYKHCECPDYCTCGRRGKAILDIAKQRNGPTDEIPLLYVKEYTLFADAV